MFATFLSFALFSTLAIRGARADLTIDTVDLTECQPVTINWSSTTGPYSLILVPTDDPCDETLIDFGEINDTSLSWIVNVTAGTDVTLSVEDATGQEAWSGSMNVTGSNSSCVAISSSAVPSSSGSSSAVSSSVPAVSTESSGSGGTTLLVKNPEATPSSDSAAPASSSGAVPVGAANTGDGPQASGALGMRQLSAPITILSVLAAIAISL